MKKEKTAKRKWWQKAAKVADKSDTAIDDAQPKDDVAAQREKELLAQRVTVDVVLKSTGRNIIFVIQVLREKLHLDLAQTKALADSAPTVIAQGMLTSEAASLANDLRAAGATIELL